jgi:hypothetical protein
LLLLLLLLPSASSRHSSSIMKLPLLWLHVHSPQLDQRCQLRVGSKVEGSPVKRLSSGVCSHKPPPTQRSSKQRVN